MAEYYQLPFDVELNATSGSGSAATIAPGSTSASIDETASGGERDAREVLLAALVQGQFEVQQKC